MPRWLTMLMGTSGGYVAGALLGYLLVQTLSGNRHDRSVEAAMTAAFVAGPVGAVIGAVASWFGTRS